MKKTVKFKRDNSSDNPALHALYVKWAIKHILIIDKAIKSFQDESNLNMLDLIVSTQMNRKKLITENKAYHDAIEFLGELASKNLIGYHNGLFVNQIGE